MESPISWSLAVAVGRDNGSCTRHVCDVPSFAGAQTRFNSLWGVLFRLYDTLLRFSARQPQVDCEMFTGQTMLAD